MSSPSSTNGTMDNALPDVESPTPTKIAHNDDFAYDGMWPWTGFGGMMVNLAEEFVVSHQELSVGDENYNNEEDYVVMETINPTDETAIVRLQENLDERGLCMADGVLRRLVEGCCPTKIRIIRLDEDTTMETLMRLKQEGNQHFVEKGYREAIDCYDAALESIPPHQRNRLHVAPKHQIAEIVNILSNKAECLLRKGKYEDAAEVATDALIFDAGHEKSRLRRAKASLETGKYDRYEATSRGDGTMSGVAYLVQAIYDLNEILDHPESSREAKSSANKVLIEAEKLLAGAKKKVLSKDPDAEFDMTILKIKSRCW